jgi:hypothetical protein
MYYLFKNPIQLETLHIVQYLHYNNIHLLPSIIIERNYPSTITQLTSIMHANKLYSGLDEVLSFYESMSGISNIAEKATAFKQQHPTYTINH